MNHRRFTNPFGCVALAACLALFGTASAGEAEVIHQVLVIHEALDGTETRDGHRLEVPTSADIDTPILASITGPSYYATAALGAFGQLGVTGQMYGNGTLCAQVSVQSDEYVNLFGSPQRAVARFVIDGGQLVLQFTPGGTLFFQLAVRADVYQDSTSLYDKLFSANAELSIPPGQETPTTVSFRGDDIGMTHIGMGVVEIPLSFQTFEIGVIPPDARIELEYLLTIEANAPQYAEGLFFQFSDPLSIDGEGALVPIVEFSDVPEPLTALLLTGGLAAMRHRRPRAPA